MKIAHSITAQRIAVLCLPARQNQACRHPLDVPFPGSVNCFIKIIEVENQAAIGAGECAQVLHVRVTANLCVDAGIGKQGEIGRHQCHTASIEAKRRDGHACHLQRYERCNASLRSGLEDLEGVVAPLGHVPMRLRGAS